MIKKNEKGYALVIVLLLVVFIMIVSVTFFTGSVSNAKQERSVDKNNMAVVAAEMGVDYYKTAITNAFNKKKSDLEEQAQDEINVLIASKGFLKKTPEEIKSSLDNIRKNLITSLNTYFNEVKASISSPPLQPISSAMNFDNLPSATIETLIDGIKIAGIVTGHSEAYSKNLDFDITFIMPEIKLSSFEGGSNGDIGFDDFYPIPAPTGLPFCPENINEKTECIVRTGLFPKNINRSSKIYLPDGLNDTGNLQLNGNNSELYAKTDFTVNNINNMSEMSLFIDGKFKAKSNANNMNNSLIKVKDSFTAENMNNINGSLLSVGGPFTTKSMQGLTNSKICVNDSFTVQGNMGGINSSDIYVNGPFTLNGKMDGNGFNIYVNGSFKVDNKIEGNQYNIYVYNPGGSLPSNHANKINVLESSFVFPEECGFDGINPSPSLEGLDWDANHDINVNY